METTSLTSVTSPSSGQSLAISEEKDAGKTWEDLLRPLLHALGWRGEEHHIQEALPFGSDVLTLQGFQDTLAHLGFTSMIRRLDPRTLDTPWLPALCLDADGTPHLLKTPDDGQKFADGPRITVLFHPAEKSVAADGGLLPLRRILSRFYPLLRHVLVASLVIGTIALAPILFNRLIYDHVIASGSARGLPMLFVGVMLALVVELILRRMRNRQLAFFGGRVDHFVSCSVFERLLFLPPSYTERVTVSAQMARLRDFESVREFFTGPLATLFFEMPLVAVYLAVMAIMGGWLVLVPVVLLAAYALLLWVMEYRMKERTRAAAQSGSRRQEFLLEMVTRLRAIRLAGLENVWQERYRRISNQASLDSFRAGYTAQVLETLSYVLMSIGGVATLGFGVMGVFNQTLTLGGLIAAMMLIWRIIAPMQVCCSSFSRLQQLKLSTGQIQRLLSLPPEHDPHVPSTLRPHIQGRVTLYRVSLRYAPDAEPALLGVSFEARPGQIIAVKGPNGSGKSTLLKMVLGLYQPQNGSVRIDGVDLRQFDPLTLRQSISYVPHTVDFFPGTIRDNLLLADPSASEEACLKALEEACALDGVRNLPDGLDTVLEGNADNIPFLLKQRLNLARAYVRTAPPIMLFDEASYSLGKADDEAFVRKIDSLRGRSTILLATHREDHMRLADLLLVLDKGELTHAGPPSQVLTILREKKP